MRREVLILFPFFNRDYSPAIIFLEDVSDNNPKKWYWIRHFLEPGI